jgi:hypothetical protein
MATSPKLIYPDILEPPGPVKCITRLGVSSPPSPTFGAETRFKWLKNASSVDCIYDLPSPNQSQKSIKFSKAMKTSPGDDVIKTKNWSASVGDYNVEASPLSEIRAQPSYRFGISNRFSPNRASSPGPIYNTGEIYRSGRDKYIKISFNCDQRKPLNDNNVVVDSANLYMLDIADHDTAKKYEFGKRLSPVKLSNKDVPGAIYDVHKVKTFKVGPSFSFGNSKSDRFKDPVDFDMTIKPITRCRSTPNMKSN